MSSRRVGCQLVCMTTYAPTVGRVDSLDQYVDLVADQRSRWLVPRSEEWLADDLASGTNGSATHLLAWVWHRPLDQGRELAPSEPGPCCCSTVVWAGALAARLC
jgi:hypothetical protein